MISEKPFGVVYLITNLTNKIVYVGQTIQTLSIRWNEHVCCKDKNGFYVQRAIKKYGKENFDITELCSASSQEELDFLEILFITALKSTDLNFGYNLRDGGSRGKHSIRSRRLMSEIAKGKPKSTEHRKNTGIGAARVWSDPSYRNRMKKIHKQRLAAMTSEQRRNLPGTLAIIATKYKLPSEIRKKIGRINSTKRRTEEQKQYNSRWTKLQWEGMTEEQKEIKLRLLWEGRVKKKTSTFSYVNLLNTILKGLI